MKLLVTIHQELNSVNPRSSPLGGLIENIDGGFYEGDLCLLFSITYKNSLNISSTYNKVSSCYAMTVSEGDLLAICSHNMGVYSK